MNKKIIVLSNLIFALVVLFSGRIKKPSPGDTHPQYSMNVSISRKIAPESGYLDEELIF